MAKRISMAEARVTGARRERRGRTTSRSFGDGLASARDLCIIAPQRGLGAGR